jgi:hypothetical protein
MFFSDYLREQAEKYRKLAEATEDPAAKKEFLELVAVCEKLANEEDGWIASTSTAPRPLTPALQRQGLVADEQIGSDQAAGLAKLPALLFKPSG